MTSSTITHGYVGKPAVRVDAPKKVTGQATYSAEFHVPGMLYGFMVTSPVALGKVMAVHDEAALAVPGVKAVISHKNAPQLSKKDKDWKDDIAPGGSPFKPFQGDDILYSGQPLALVVAETFELARYAAKLVTFSIDKKEHLTDLHSPGAVSKPAGPGKMGFQPPPDKRGDPEGAWESATAKIEVDYDIPPQHHNPMEMHSTTAQWDGDKLTVWTKTQGVINTQNFLSGVFGIKAEQIHIISPFVGGAFGSGLRPQHECVLAVMAAQVLGKPVKVTCTRQQMFTFGHRPHASQHLKLAASPEGKLLALVHEAKLETSRFEAYTETVVNWSGTLYTCDNAAFDYQVVPLDVYTPLDMRAPGGVTGVHAIECAMDEMAYEIKMDPLQFRLLNNSKREGNDNRPYSSKKLDECLTQGAEAFGWKDRKIEPRSMQDGHELIGWGMASGIWEVMFMPAAAKAHLTAAGMLTISVASSDIGTGTYTILSQLAADSLGIPIDRVEVVLGDSSLPQAPIQGGSMTAASVGTAVRKACFAVIDKLTELREKHGLAETLTASQLLREAGVSHVEVTAQSAPDGLSANYAKYAHTASFVEVRVDEDLGIVRVTRIVTATAAGRILNPRTARSQVAGCAVWGIGFALAEETMMDHEIGRFMNHSLAEYHVPVNADVPETEVIFVHEDDTYVNPLGVKGIGEVGMVGMSAAIANAVFHATGKRVRNLPIQVDDLVESAP